MKVFISWSGARSRVVAQGLTDWLPRVIHGIEPYFSVETNVGGVWHRQLIHALKEAELGIFCLTPENAHADWILFEAGALAMTLGEAEAGTQTKLFPYLYDFKAVDKLEGPFQEIQYTQANREGTRKLISDVNATLGHPLSDAVLSDSFRVWWPELEKKLNAIGQLDNIDRGEAIFMKSIKEIKQVKKDNLDLAQNDYFQHIINHSIEDVAEGLNKITSSSPSYSVLLVKSRNSCKSRGMS